MGLHLHDNDIKVVLDGVFNHAGRGFYQFQDVVKNRESSPYREWFNIDFNGNSHYNDGLWYEGWEGNYDLVKLNLRNEEVVNHLLLMSRYLMSCQNSYLNWLQSKRIAIV